MFSILPGDVNLAARLVPVAAIFTKP